MVSRSTTAARVYRHGRSPMGSSRFKRAAPEVCPANRECREVDTGQGPHRGFSPGAPAMAGSRERPPASWMQGRPARAVIYAYLARRGSVAAVRRDTGLRGVGRLSAAWAKCTISRRRARPLPKYLTPRWARRAVSDSAGVLVNYILGIAGQSAANARALANSNMDRSTFLSTVAAQWAQLDPAKYPSVHKARTQLREHDDREQFLARIDLILAGIETVNRAGK
jgi:hypothetical protein